jgi:hypothetical protein
MKKKSKSKSNTVSKKENQKQESNSTTLKDFLTPDVLKKLNEQTEELKNEEVRRAEEKRKNLEKAQKEKEKELENNFDHLLSNSKLDWRNYK